MDKKQYNIDGFIFLSEEDYKVANEEWNTVEYIKKNSDLSNTTVVYKLYNKLVEKNAFKTIIGLSFQKSLRDTLIKDGSYKEEDLKPILVRERKVEQNIEPNKNTLRQSTHESSKESKEDRITALRNARIVNIFLVLTIFAMFLINILQ